MEHLIWRFWLHGVDQEEAYCYWAAFLHEDRIGHILHLGILALYKTEFNQDLEQAHFQLRS